MLEDRCLEEEDFLALLAGDQSPEAWREHMRGCPECHDLFSAQEPLRRALEEPAQQPTDAQVKAARARLDEALRLRLGQQAAADIRRLFSPEVIGRRYVRRLAAFSLWCPAARRLTAGLGNCRDRENP